MISTHTSDSRFQGMSWRGSSEVQDVAQADLQAVKSTELTL